MNRFLQFAVLVACLALVQADPIDITALRNKFRTRFAANSRASASVNRDGHSAQAASAAQSFCNLSNKGTQTGAAAAADARVDGQKVVVVQTTTTTTTTPPPPPPPAKPQVHLETFMEHNPAMEAASYARANPYGAAAAAAVSAGHGHGDYDEHEEYEDETDDEFAEGSGDFAADDFEHEHTEHKEAHEDIENHEEGDVESDNYLNAHGYNREEDEASHEAYNKANENVDHTADRYKASKNSENYVKTYNKKVRAVGHGILAKNHHKSGFKRGNKKSTKNINTVHSRIRNGLVEEDVENEDHNNEAADEDIYDSAQFNPAAHASANAAAAARVHP